MTLQTLVIIILCFLAIVLLLGTLLVTFLIGRFSVKDNPKKALVFVKTGTHINKPFKADLSETDKTGKSFFYGDKKITFYPSTYKEYFYRGRLMIFISYTGQLIASPFDDNIELGTDERESLIYELCASHVGSDGMRALKGKGTMSVLIIAAISFVLGIAVVFGYNAFQEQMSKRTINIPQSQQVPQELQIEELK